MIDPGCDFSTFLLESLDCGDPYLRRNFIGASDAPIIMGVSPWRTPLQLYQEKIGLIGQQKENEAMARGTQLEDEARKKFEKVMNCKVTPKRLFSPWHDFMMASLDGIDKSGKIVVEIKCGKASHKQAQLGEIPKHYYPQLQHQMYVANVDKIHYFSYQSDKDWDLINCERDDEYIKELIDKETEFWNCVKELREPGKMKKDEKKEFEEINNISVLLISSELKNIRDCIKSYKETEERLEKEIIKLCGEKNSKGYGITLQKISKSGSIDYSQIKELSSIDLEKYRKKTSEYWKITIEDE